MHNQNLKSNNKIKNVLIKVLKRIYIYLKIENKDSLNMNMNMNIYTEYLRHDEKVVYYTERKY